MNKRIKELAERAVEEMDQEAFSEAMYIPDEYLEKFAELIIKEVINSIDSTGFNHVQKHGLRTTILSNLGYKYPYSEFE